MIAMQKCNKFPKLQLKKGCFFIQHLPNFAVVYTSGAIGKFGKDESISLDSKTMCFIISGSSVNLKSWLKEDPAFC